MTFLKRETRKVIAAMQEKNYHSKKIIFVPQYPHKVHPLRTILRGRLICNMKNRRMYILHIAFTVSADSIVSEFGSNFLLTEGNLLRVANIEQFD